MASDRELADLRRRIAAGEYAVDSRAVADAMLRRMPGALRPGGRSRMLVAAELDRLSARVHEGQSGSANDSA